MVPAISHDDFVLVLLRYQDPSVEADNVESAELLALLNAALAALREAPGFVRGWVGRSPDDLTQWVLASSWADVGSMRRGMGSFAAKMTLGPLQSFANEASGAFEVLTTAEKSEESHYASGLSPDAHTAHPE